MKKNIIFGYLIVFSLFLNSCIEQEVDSLNYGTTYKVDNFNIAILDYENLPYFRSSPVPLDYYDLTDEDGIILSERNGELTYHPVALAQVAIKFIESYRVTEDIAYKEISELYLNKLIEIADFYDGMPFFPYEFDFKLHDLEDQLMVANWYSGMAQGQALSCFVHMYELTGEEYYINWADEIYRSIAALRTEECGKFWVTVADLNEYLWVEEYPLDEFNYTLNGTIFAIYGIYDYYRINPENEGVKQILDASLTTIKDNIIQFRNPGNPSFYCLKHKKPSVSYHQVHIRQLRMLYKITNDKYFDDIAELFISDYYDY